MTADELIERLEDVRDNFSVFIKKDQLSRLEGQLAWIYGECLRIGKVQDQIFEIINSSLESKINKKDIIDKFYETLCDDILAVTKDLYNEFQCDFPIFESIEESSKQELYKEWVS